MKIFIDFDDVIFCSKFFVRDFFLIFKRNGISKKIFRDSYYSENGKVKGVKYQLENQLKRLKKLGFDVDKINKEINDFLEDSPKYVFNDVRKFLESFSKKELYLVSYAKTKFQKEKVRRADVSKFFQKIIITDGKKSDEIKKVLKNRKEKSFFIDDRIEQIGEVKHEIPGVATIFIKRNKGRYQDRRSVYCDFEVKNLSEALKIINSEK